MDITSLMPSPTANIYFDEAFRNVIESYLPSLRTRLDTVEITIQPHDAYKYEFDFYGLLDQYKIDRAYHWIVMRVNNIVSPMDFDITITTLKIPSPDYIEQIRTIHNGMIKKSSV